MTARLSELRGGLINDSLATVSQVEAAERPIVLDVGAAASGLPEFFSGSDSLLVLKVSDVPVTVHAFDISSIVAQELRQAAAIVLRKAPRGSTHAVYAVGVGARSGTLTASPMRGTDKVRTLTLTGGSGQSRRGNVFQTKVMSLDDWESTQGFDRPIFYIKVDVNGHEPAVLQGMTRLISTKPPPFLSFEYSSGWNPVFGNITMQLKERASKQRDGMPALAWEDHASVTPSLREFVHNLSRANYAVYLTHVSPAQPEILDLYPTSLWWFRPSSLTQHDELLHLAGTRVVANRWRMVAKRIRVGA